MSKGSNSTRTSGASTTRSNTTAGGVNDVITRANNNALILDYPSRMSDTVLRSTARKISDSIRIVEETRTTDERTYRHKEETVSTLRNRLKQITDEAQNRNIKL